MKNVFFIVVFFLTGCSHFVSVIQTHNKVPVDTYPSALALNPEIAENPPVIDLAQYKSVHLRFKKKSDVAIALAASGGGYRAANFTLGVMLGLEKLHSSTLNSNLLEAIDYYSTVSGGGLAVGYYLDQLHNHQISTANEPFSLASTISASPLSADLSEFLFFGKDRGLRLEAKLNELIFNTNHGDSRSELTLGDIFVPKNSPQSVYLPYWAANSTIYQNGAIFPFAPDILQRYQVTGYYHNKKLFPLHDPYHFPVSIGATASASIPFVTPSTTLISNGCGDNCYLHLFDGGLADNLGIYTALNFLLQDKSKTKVLIIVDASISSLQPYSQLETNPKPLSLIRRLPELNLDANRQHIRPNIKFLVHHLLNGKKIAVIYFDLQQYPLAQKISTSLAIAQKDQQTLVEIGQQLVAKNQALRKLLADIDHLTLHHM